VQYRPSRGAAAVTLATVDASLPLYLQVMRAGNTFTASTSPDGSAYTSVPNGSVSLPGLSTTLHVGMAVNSASSGAQSTASFNNLDIFGTTTTPLATGADVTTQDTHTEHYTQLANNVTDLQLYNSPSGISGASQWQMRDPTLNPVAGTTMLTATNLPFDEQVASTSAGLTPGSGAPAPVLAALTSENGVTLGVGLPITSATPTAVAGQASGNTVTYPGVLRPVGTPPSTPTPTITSTLPPSSTAGSLNVFVGYADSARPSPNLPVPWAGSPNTVFVGDSGSYDAGAIRLDNTASSTITVRDISVYFPNHPFPSPNSSQVFDLWGSFSVPAGQRAILTETSNFNFDTSDGPIPGATCANPAGPTNSPPVITVTFGDGRQAVVTDTGHILDTGGLDSTTCSASGNESLQWRAVGTVGASQAAGNLVVRAPAYPQAIGTPAAVVANLTDPSGQPQPNVQVTFSITGGPNAGLTGQATTDGQGNAPFTYTSAVTGTDSIVASVANASGGSFSSNPVTVTWTTPPAPADLTLRATVSGLDARLVLRGPNQTGPFALSLSPAPGTSLAQDPDGTVRVLQQATSYGDDGVTPYVVTHTEYLLSPPLLTDSSPDSAAPAMTGPATVTLGAAVTSTDGLTVTLDQAWLHDPRRVFPVMLDLPLATAYSAANTGLFGTVSSCNPTAPARQSAMVVGSEGGCGYNGQVYFDSSTLQDRGPVASATLRLYTAAQTTATGVQVLPNVPLSTTTVLPPTPTWNTAPATVAGASPIAQSGSDGHWQSWDVTALVQGWQRNDASNGGLTLTGSGTPLAFASALGAGTDSPTHAPVLDITYAPPAAATGAPVSAGSPSDPYYDSATSIYGIAGGVNPQPASKCQPPVCGNSLALTAVRDSLGGSLYRITLNMNCQDTSRSPSRSALNGSQPYGVANPNYWSTFTYRPVGADPFEHLVSVDRSVAAAFAKHLVPVIVFNTTDSTTCENFFGLHHDQATANTTALQHWHDELQAFATYMTSKLGNAFRSHFVYYEILNEANLKSDAYFVHAYTVQVSNGRGGMVTLPADDYNFAQIFGAAARGLSDGMQANGAPPSSYRILTGGLIEPAPTDFCDYNAPGGYAANNHYVAAVAINTALANGIGYSQLGFAVHPYNYNTYDHNPRTPGGNDTATTGYWRNYYHEYGTDGNLHAGFTRYNGYPGVCRDLGKMIALWSGTRNLNDNGHRLPIVFTEDNWSDQQTMQYRLDPHNVFRTPPQPWGGPGDPAPHALSTITDINDGHANQHCANPDGCEAAYLADLFTWLYDHGYAGGANHKPISQEPLRVLLFHGADGGTSDDTLGVYGLGGRRKVAVIKQCPNLTHGRSPVITNLSASDYVLRLEHNGCYNAPSPNH